jgi:hypothetical protein
MSNKQEPLNMDMKNKNATEKSLLEYLLFSVLYCFHEYSRTNDKDWGGGGMKMCNAYLTKWCANHLDHKYSETYSYPEEGTSVK